MTEEETEKVIEDNKSNPEIEGFGKEQPKDEKTEEKQEPSAEDLQKQLTKLQRKLTNKTEEAERVHKKLEIFEKKEEEKADAELSEIGKLNKQISEKDELLSRAEKALKEIQWNEQRRKVAREIGLPDEFAHRIEGTTREELEEDAKKVLDAIPARKSVSISPTIPGGNATDKPSENIDEILDFYGF